MRADAGEILPTTRERGPFFPADLPQSCPGLAAARLRPMAGVTFVTPGWPNTLAFPTTRVSQGQGEQSEPLSGRWFNQRRALYPARVDTP
jgi:hypothetical protein